MSLRQLSGLDATFLFIETPEMPMHVGAVHLLELPDGYRGRYVADLRRHLASRLPAAPVLRRRLWSMPLNLANPAWVDAEPDLAEHVVEIRLTREQARGRDALALMEEQVERLHPVLLDRRRPLWKFHVVEGLPPGPGGRRQVGLYSQLHHAAVDGQAAVALANVIFDVVPQAPALQVRASRRPRTFRLDMVEMLRRRRTTMLSDELLKTPPHHFIQQPEERNQARLSSTVRPDQDIHRAKLYVRLTNRLVTTEHESVEFQHKINRSFGSTPNRVRGLGKGIWRVYKQWPALSERSVVTRTHSLRGPRCP